MELTFPLFAGLIASILHVISGPDHLAAVTPFAISSKKRAWKVGLLWGFGHLLGMISIGIIFLIFKEAIPIEEISKHSEKIIGIILIFMGLWIILKIFKQDKKHKHLHVHSQQNVIIHKHKHIHNSENSHNHKHQNIKQSNIASLTIGIIHGFAGISHFLLLIPVIGFSSNIDSIKYIIGFAVGTIISMTSFAFVIGKISSFSKNEHNDPFNKGIRLVGGLFALIIGIYWTINS